MIRSRHNLLARMVPAAVMAACVAAPCLAAEPASPQATPANVRATTLIGLPVTNDNDQKLGKVDDLMLSRTGTITRVVLSLDGGAGYGRKLVAVPYKEVKISSSGVTYSATPDKLQALPEFSYGPRQPVASDGERARYADQTKRKMSEWETRLDQAKKTTREGTADAGRKLDSAWSAVKDKWSDVENASADGWKRAKSDFERAWANLERTWKDQKR